MKGWIQLFAFIRDLLLGEWDAAVAPTAKALMVCWDMLVNVKVDDRSSKVYKDLSGYLALSGRQVLLLMLVKVCMTDTAATGGV